MLYNYFKNKVNEIKNNYIVSDEDKNTLFERTDTRRGLFANYTIIFFILVSIVIVFLDSIPKISDQFYYTFFTIDLIISSTFLVEYVYRWSKSNHKYEFPFRLLNLLDLLSFLPFFILIIFYGIGTYSIFVIFRVFRILRIFELIERVNIIKKLLKGINKHKIDYLSAIFVIFIILVLSSTIVFLAEQKWGNPNLFRSIPSALWWAIVTMTTTGYGDMVPISIISKIIATFLMFLGPVLIAIISSITVIIFLDSTRIITFNNRENTCGICGKDNPNDAKYCNKCGKKLKKINSF
ncbi:MAG: ion transporter [Candidatus Gracilibacteria bacterium]|nr:ion transporter [Candidatus Gracilibacteria bacterium]